MALNVYVALCYYKLDYYDVSQEVLQVYLQKYPDSAISINLKACNHFRLYDGNAAQAELRQLVETTSSYSFGHDLIRHNSVVIALDPIYLNLSFNKKNCSRCLRKVKEH